MAKNRHVWSTKKSWKRTSPEVSMMVVGPNFDRKKKFLACVAMNRPERAKVSIDSSTQPMSRLVIRLSPATV